MQKNFFLENSNFQSRLLYRMVEWQRVVFLWALSVSWSRRNSFIRSKLVLSLISCAKIHRACTKYNLYKERNLKIFLHTNCFWNLWKTIWRMVFSIIFQYFSALTLNLWSLLINNFFKYHYLKFIMHILIKKAVFVY